MKTASPFLAYSSFWPGVFRLKGVWNCTISVGMFFGEDKLRVWLDAPATDPVYRALFLALAFIFGLGYWRVGSDITRNHDIIRMGILGQLSVFVILVYAVFYALRPLPWPFLMAGVVDLVFAIAFVSFLRFESMIRQEEGSNHA